jgi:hypothetical protein
MTKKYGLTFGGLTVYPSIDMLGEPQTRYLADARAYIMREKSLLKLKLTKVSLAGKHCL